MPAPFLAQVKIASASLFANDALHSLGGMVRLHHLDFNFTLFGPSNFFGISNLVNLESMSLRLGLVEDEEMSVLSLADQAAIFSLTRLTLLELKKAAPEHSDDDEDDDGDEALATAPSDGLSALFRTIQVQNLVHLRKLVLDTRCVVDGEMMEQLQRLTQLTALEVGSIRLAHSGPGHLPGWPTYG